MKKLSHVYSYSTVTGIATHRVIEHRRDWIAILPRPDSFCAQSLPISELDAGRYYYTTPARAAEAFVVKAKAVLADSTRAEGHDGWRTALAAARSFLCQKPRARTSALTKGHAK